MGNMTGNIKCLEWQKQTGVDCYENQGGDPVLPDPYSDSVSLSQCQAACETDSSCEGIIRRSAEGEGSGICYKRKNIVLVRCVRDPVWDLHLKKGSGGKFLVIWSKYTKL